jgi:hypothetical protein
VTGSTLATAASIAILVVGVFAALDTLEIAPNFVNGLFYALLAVIAGVLELLPIIGPILAMIPTLLVALTTADPVVALVIAGLASGKGSGPGAGTAAAPRPGSPSRWILARNRPARTAAPAAHSTDRSRIRRISLRGQGTGCSTDHSGRANGEPPPSGKSHSCQTIRSCVPDDGCSPSRPGSPQP